MPRFYFNVRSPSGLETDNQGVEFANIDDAIVDARKAAAEMLLDQVMEETRGRHSDTAFEIVDASGQVVARVPFGA
jgi:hypothetical protein